MEVVKMNDEEVKKLIGKKQWTSFKKWIKGQTVSIDEDGKENYYNSDVDDYINKKEDKKEV